MSAARTAASLRSGPGTSISDVSFANSLADARPGPKLARAFCVVGHPKAGIKRLRQSTAGELRTAEYPLQMMGSEHSGGRHLENVTRIRTLHYSAICSPDPPNSAGKSFSFGSPSRIGRTVSA